MNLIHPKKVQELIDHGFDLDISGILSESIDMVKQELGLFVGYTLVYFLLVMAAGMIPFANLIITPPLLAGYYLFAHKIHKNEFREFGDFFKGFDYFGPLVIQYLILMGIMLLVCLPMLASMLSLGMFSSSFSEPQFGLVAILSFLLSLVGIIYVSTVYIFAPFFVIFGDYQFWDAMEASRKIVGQNFWIVFGLVIVTFLFMVAGVLLCFVGALFTLPAGYVAFYVAFKNLVDLGTVDGTDEQDILDHLVD